MTDERDYLELEAVRFDECDGGHGGLRSKAWADGGWRRRRDAAGAGRCSEGRDLLRGVDGFGGLLVGLAAELDAADD
ncbi:MAG: hypothetical protein ACRDL5_15805, partial [Solirubrobacteraceae bacterium]